MNWVKDAGFELPDAPEKSAIPQRGDGRKLEFDSSCRLPEITEINDSQTFAENKTSIGWLWTVVHHRKPDGVRWTSGKHSSSNFQVLWSTIKFWHSF
jgi:hypothetical protein